MSTPILELQNLRKVFDHDLLRKKEVVIDQLSCTFPSGKCTGLFGHNGAGKTTTIRMIFGMIKPDQGQILFNGRPLQLADKQQIGYMPETNKLPAALTPEEILHHQLSIYGVGRDRAERKALVTSSLARVGLANHKTKRIGKLSKGMGRRLAWAQATIHNPSLVILDEPSSGMDPLGRRDMNDWIGELKQRGTSILLCTHDLGAMENLCDEFHILRAGRLVYSTLQAVSGQDKYQVRRSGKTPIYQLKVSGLTLDHLAKAKQELQLPTYSDAQQDGLLATIYFDDYGHVAPWLNFFNTRGIVIVSFGAAPALEGQALGELFDGGQRP